MYIDMNTNEACVNSDDEVFKEVIDVLIEYFEKLKNASNAKIRMNYNKIEEFPENPTPTDFIYHHVDTYIETLTITTIEKKNLGGK